MSDPIKDASESGWIAEHRAKYLADPKAGHLWDSTFAGGPGPLPTLLLTTRGAKSGQESVMPLLYGKVDGGYAIIASKGGHPKHPAWFHNLRAHPDTTVQIGREKREVHARVATPVERERLWPKAVATYSGYEGYQERTDREIPVVILEPR